MLREYTLVRFANVRTAKEEEWKMLECCISEEVREVIAYDMHILTIILTIPHPGGDPGLSISSLLELCS